MKSEHEELKERMLVGMRDSWEKANNELKDKGGVNPEAYKLGFCDCFNLLLDRLEFHELSKFINKL